MLMKWLLARGLSPSKAGLLAHVALPLLLVLLFFVERGAFADRRYGAGKAAENAAWKLASDKLVAQAAASGDAATRAQTSAIAAQAVKIEKEKEKIDEATRNGTSPFDALFPSAGGVR